MDNSIEAYQKPTADVVGTVADLTEGGKVGSSLDATFPVGTPFSDLTVS
jgi:hypothetical protein